MQLNLHPIREGLPTIHVRAIGLAVDLSGPTLSEKRVVVDY
jgi:hypothetical protein